MSTALSLESGLHVALHVEKELEKEALSAKYFSNFQGLSRDCPTLSVQALDPMISKFA
jgi:hypothetical protein